MLILMLRPLFAEGLEGSYVSGIGYCLQLVAVRVGWLYACLIFLGAKLDTSLQRRYTLLAIKRIQEIIHESQY